MRQFVIEKNPDKNGLIFLTGKDFKYLHQVLRIKTGDMLNASLPDGSLQNFTVASCDFKSKKIVLQICASSDFSEKNVTRGVSAEDILDEKNSGKSVEVWMIQFIPKTQKLEQIVKQATECGVKKILLVNSEYTEESSLMSLAGSKQERLLKIIKEARQQSGSPVQTEFTKPLKLNEAIDIWKNHLQEENYSENEYCSFVLSERNEKTFFIDEIFEKKEKICSVCLVVGNEGGVSPYEIDLLLENGFSAVHFAGNILRCETAALYGIACAQTFAGKNNREKEINLQSKSDDNSYEAEKDSLEIQEIEKEYGDEAWL